MNSQDRLFEKLNEQDDLHGEGKPKEYVPMEKALQLLQMIQAGKINWHGDNQMKYVNMRVDTRDGKVLITDRNGAYVDIDEYLGRTDGEG